MAKPGKAGKGMAKAYRDKISSSMLAYWKKRKASERKARRAA